MHEYTFTNDFAQAFADNARLANLYENKAEIALANYIHEVQQKTKEKTFIKFNDETGYPSFTDYSRDYKENIYGLKAVGSEDSRTFLIYTDSQPYAEMESNEDGWFPWQDYGELSMEDVFYNVNELNKDLSA